MINNNTRQTISKKRDYENPKWVYIFRSTWLIAESIYKFLSISKRRFVYGDTSHEMSCTEKASLGTN